jgi:hypothetical protein
MAEVAVPRQMLADILSLIARQGEAIAFQSLSWAEIVVRGAH